KLPEPKIRRTKASVLDSHLVLRFFESLIISLVNLTQHFAADILLPRFTVAVNAAGGADNGNAHSAEHGTHFLGLAIDPAAGRADSLDVLDDDLAAGAVLQFQAEVTDRV